MSFLQKIFGSKNQRELKRMQPTVARIADLEPTMEAKSDADLRAMTADFKRRLDKGATLEEILPEAFAVVREAGKRVLGMRHYDVQMIGGMVLNSGRIAEMRTGEGKTLVATLPCYLNALTGKGVHVVTVNDYLAKRDAEWMGRLHGFLGLSTGVVVHGLEDFERQRNYNCDITYGQNNEFGFDYLRDNMKSAPDRMVQRGLNYAIVDEVDSILIDEARTPLIISGSAEQSADLYDKVDKIIPRHKREVDYTVDEKAHSAMLTDEGVEKVERLLSIDNLYDPKHLQVNHHVQQALRAHTLYKRDVNYLIEEGKVLIIDEFTGRKMPGRRWSDGLHQAIEAKEGVTVEEENQTLATITFQNYFRMYGKLSGMTGTADTEAGEFHEIYKLMVTVIPTNKPIRREDQPDLVYKNEKGKFRAVVDDIIDCHERGQPTLVGTVSVEKSEVLASILRSKNVEYHVLNAKQHQREAGIVAQAGRKGSITIATNMAGRGTDILLGGNPEFMAKEALALEKSAVADEAAQAKPVEGAEPAEGGESPYRGSVGPAFDEDARFKELLAKFKEQCDAEKAEVLAAGGLKIIGTERHESRRIDNQLRGRAGRQGDPGASRFYLSLEDDLLRIFGLDRMAGLMERLGLEEDVPIESGMVTRSIEGAQKKVEGRNFDTRKNTLEYDDVMNQQRKTIYSLRKQILYGLYQPELTEDEIKAGKEPEPPRVESGPWKLAELAKELRPKVAERIEQVVKNAADRDAAKERGEEVTEDRPLWRMLRHEIWRQYGAHLDLERKVDGDREALIDFVAESVAQSMISQRERIYDLCDSLLGRIIETACPSTTPEDEWDLDAVEDALREQFAIDFELERGSLDELVEQAWKPIEARLKERETEFHHDPELSQAWFYYFGRSFQLEEIDQQWIEHLKTMEALREGIGLVGYGQKDPKKEYKKVGYDMFADMMARVQSNVATKLFRVQIQREEQAVPALEQKQRQLHEQGAADKSDDDVDAEVKQKERRVAKRGAQRGGARPQQKADGGDAAKQETVRRDKPKVGRNDPCPCGSGKKYKKCHGKDEAESASE
ncbi:MAG TPA: preprotein translocase subunit SecA [Kofleriaceae bacterium]|nr:preprotein translocase subunit SecA [Kofleriaceae bacterium]